MAASFGNPASFAWADALATVSQRVSLLDLRSNANDGLHPFERLGSSGADASDRDNESSIEPDVLFLWWGHNSLHSLDRLSEKYPGAATYVCVDTLPDASGLPGEIREILRYRSRRRAVKGFIVSSDAMKEDFRRFVGKNHRVFVAPYVFLARSQEYGWDALPPRFRLPSAGGKPRVLFTGRPDYLFSKERSMLKDALGYALTEFHDSGAEVFTSALAGGAGERFVEYPVFTSEEMLDGTFATFSSQFDLVLVGYNTHSRTIRRRVSNGLSTRGAIALLASTPQCVPVHALDMCRDIWLGADIEVGFESARSALAWALENQQCARDQWWQRHDRYTFEAIAEDFREFVLGG